MLLWQNPALELPPFPSVVENGSVKTSIESPRLLTGIPGLDDILLGGLPKSGSQFDHPRAQFGKLRTAQVKPTPNVRSGLEEQMKLKMI
jgi:hypothetical protein